METQTKRLNINHIIQSANTLFNDIGFRHLRVVPNTLVTYEYSIKVDNLTIPVISEWTYGEGEVLVFNDIDSCLGIICIYNGQLRGAHLSLLKGNLNYIVEEQDFHNVMNQFNGFTVNSFGGSIDIWEQIFTDSSVNIPKKIANDRECKKWIFYIENRQIAYQPFN